MSRVLPCPFFKTWNREMTYVLGYWFADGNIYTQKSCGSYVVSISSKDVEHLARLRDVIGVGRLTRITGSDVFKLVIWLYHYHPGLHLARKCVIADQFRFWHPQKFFPHRVTAKMWAMFGAYLP